VARVFGFTLCRGGEKGEKILDQRKRGGLFFFSGGVGWYDFLVFFSCCFFFFFSICSFSVSFLRFSFLPPLSLFFPLSCLSQLHNPPPPSFFPSPPLSFFSTSPSRGFALLLWCFAVLFFGYLNFFVFSYFFSFSSSFSCVFCVFWVGFLFCCLVLRFYFLCIPPAFVCGMRVGVGFVGVKSVLFVCLLKGGYGSWAFGTLMRSNDSVVVCCFVGVCSVSFVLVCPVCLSWISLGLGFYNYVNVCPSCLPPPFVIFFFSFLFFFVFCCSFVFFFFLFWAVWFAHLPFVNFL